MSVTKLTQCWIIAEITCNFTQKKHVLKLRAEGSEISLSSRLRKSKNI